MSTIKSSAENLTLNADGSGNDVIIQSNGSTKTIVTAEGNVGIGMSPVKTLDVNSGSGVNVARFTSTAAEASIQIVNDARTWSWGVRDISSNTNAAFIHDNGASADRLVISTAGVVSIPVGIELGSGVDGTAANTLDDYEEGTWTPAVATGTNGSIWAQYTKIGRQVTLQCSLSQFSNTSSSNTVYVDGLPFVCKTPVESAGAVHGERTSLNNLVVATEAGDDRLYFRGGVGTSNYVVLTHANINDGADVDLKFTITYNV